MDSTWITFISACTALVASIVGPLVTLAVAKRQFSAVAELMSIFVAMMVVKRAWKGPWDHGAHALASNPMFVGKLERAVMVQWEIRLLIKPHEPGHQELLETIMGTVERLRGEELQEAEVQADLERITTLAQGVLRYEWERVKKGV
jgi:hypothetical protein